MLHELKRSLHYLFISSLVAVVAVALCSRFLYAIELSLANASRTGAFSCFICAGLLYTRKRYKDASEKRTVKGTKLVSPLAYQRLIMGEGIGFEVFQEQTCLGKLLKRQADPLWLRIRNEDEKHHFLFVGDTGMGKSALFHTMLPQIRDREPETGERCVIYDPSLEFAQHHARDTDVILYPLSPQAPYWDLADEVDSPLAAAQIAESFIPHKVNDNDCFFTMAAQRLFAFLLWELAKEQERMSVLIKWLCDPEWLRDKIEGTEVAFFIDREAGKQSAAVLASMSGKIVSLLKLLPPDDGRSHFSFTQWAEEQSCRWVFIGTKGQSERAALLPLIATWLDISLAKTMKKQRQKPLWLFVDEVASLQRLPCLGTALFEARKYQIRCVLGLQGRAQLYQRYGVHDAEAMLSCVGTKIFLRNSEYNAAEWAAKNIGMPVQTSDRESYTSTIGGGRDSVSTHNETNVDYLVTPNEIQNLKKLHGYFRYDEYVVPIRFQYPTLTGKDDSLIVSEQVIEEVVDPLLLPDAVSLDWIDSNVRAPLRRVK
jgi:hypothetical protein